MHALKQEDPQAEFRYFGGDMMAAEGGTLVQHYRDLAYMGFIPVLLHARTILRGMSQCKEDIIRWQPNVLILIDYPGFNLKIAKYIHANSQILVYYYISPKIWAWKEHRIKAIKRDVDRLFSILPFEVEFFEQKHHYPITYVGNPTVDEVEAYKQTHPEDHKSFRQDNHLDERPIIALLAGSRKQEIRDNLTLMTEAARPFSDAYQLVLAAAPGIEESYYVECTNGLPVKVLHNQTYRILQHSTAALVTSGTATLETALFRVPQVVCYYMRMGRLFSFLRRHFLKVPFVSLVNLVANKEVVVELVADGMTVENAHDCLQAILPGGSARSNILDGYTYMAERLGKPGAPQHAAKEIIKGLI